MVCCMSFTQDELQALNTLFDQKMAVLRRDLERSLDGRIQVIRREFEQRMVTTLQDLLRGVVRRFGEQQHKFRDSLYHRLDAQQARTLQAISGEGEQRQQAQQLDDVVERALAAQLLAIEQLINQRLPLQPTEISLPYNGENKPEFDAIEVQTEIPWEDLVELIEKVLDERLVEVTSTLQMRLREMERALTVQINILHGEPGREPGAEAQENPVASLVSLQDVFASIEQLERIVESMQVAMTANSALISNRLYHHQQLPPERAHPTHPTVLSSEQQAERENNPIPFLKKRENDEG